ncbi:chemotaxis protein CheW [Desulfolutivibrio sulfoxidireducens]|uniref:chemotaxis protein CheW n=1 Tax=Desulfolutivibrio sulfoxidireducens TaxID=2773299 RepID=UPI00159D0EB5|nr:chemotaxis protein CheW [Desulfolutivibrio sulfoxidireducens]QLA17477.1 chemotaxis protein CheW [Desulfolutivibrio sulfoxidireducens]QLA21062.1 chemotaxis protein CheW [Desulfolutivibrio sulfoxidireducens]
MLFVLFRAGQGRYAVRAALVRRIVPLVRLAEAPGAPPYVAGLMNHRGRVVPVVDVSGLLCGGRSRPLLSTRIILAECADPRTGTSRLLGLLAEGVTETASREDADVRPPEIDAAPYVAGLFLEDGEVVQIVSPGEALPAEVARALFRDRDGQSGPVDQSGAALDAVGEADA